MENRRLDTKQPSSPRHQNSLQGRDHNGPALLCYAKGGSPPIVAMSQTLNIRSVKMTRLTPMLPVKSMPASLTFYCEMLGFQVEKRIDD